MYEIRISVACSETMSHDYPMDSQPKPHPRESRLRLSYLYGGEVVYQPGEKLKPRVLDDYELVYVISGVATYAVDGSPHEAPPGTVILGRAGSEEHYSWDPKHTTRHAFFHFGIEALPGDWPAPEAWPVLRENPAPVVVSLFRHVMRHIYEHSNWPAESPGERDCLLVETLVDAFLETHPEEETSFERDRPEPVRRALKWMRQQIDDAPSERFTLGDIAAAAGCTPKHLCRVFSSSLGHTPARTGVLLRLQLATALLTRTNLTVKEIALRCGFENPLYFSRCFSKTFGRAPTAVRTDLAKGIPPPADPLPVDVTPRVSW